MNEGETILYAREADLDADAFRRVLVESGLAAIRPVDDRPRLARMLAQADLVVTARDRGPERALLGVARCISDFSWCAYLSELAVCESAQGRGIGRGLLEATRGLLGPQVSLILASVPEAAAFYRRAGMDAMADTFWYKRER